MIKAIRNPTSEEISRFELFAKKNWGEHSQNGDASLDFYDRHRIIYENFVNDELVSGLVVFFKTIVFSERIIQIAGIGGVVTHFSYRHKGYALENLQFMLKELRQMDIDVAFLCTEIEKLGIFYEKAGFVALNKPYSFIDKDGNRKEELGGMIANLGDDDAFDHLLNTTEEIFVGLSNF